MRSKRKGILFQLSPRELETDITPNPNNRIDGVRKEQHRSRLNNIKHNLTKFGYKRGFPIICNEEFVICDGHHRVQACIDMKIDAWVLVDPEARVEDYAQITASANKWNINDFVKAAVNRGSQNAKIIEHFMEKYDLKANIIILVEYGEHVKRHDTIEMLQNDTLVIKDIEVLKSKLQHIKDCLALMIFCDYKIISAIATLMRHHSYRETVMLTKLEQKGGDMHGSSSIKGYMEQLQRVYNHGSRSRKIYFL